MKKYLTKFTNNTQYKQFLGSTECPEVNVSYITDTSTVEYFDAKVVKKPFTITATNGAGQSFEYYHVQIYYGNLQNPVSYKYSFDGETWYASSQWAGPYDGNRIENIPIGQSVSIITDLTDQPAQADRITIEVLDQTYDSGARGNLHIKFEGNIQSLYFGDKFYEHNEIYKLSDGRSVFNDIESRFGRVQDVEDLYLPTTGDLTSAYENLFYDGWLENVPKLTFNISEPGYHTFYNMFHNCTSLTDASNLTFNFAKYIHGERECMAYMFSDCTSLTEGPVMNFESTTLMGANKIFCGMFSNCSSLTTLHINNLDKLYQDYLQGAWNNDGYNGGEAYRDMFRGCSSLVSDTTLTNLKVMNIVNGDYNNMFRDCTSLQHMPKFYCINGYNFFTEDSWQGTDSLQEFHYYSPKAPGYEYQLPNTHYQLPLYLPDYVDYDINSVIDSSQLSVQNTPQRVEMFYGYYLWSFRQIGTVSYNMFRNGEERDVDDSNINNVVVMIEGQAFNSWEQYTVDSNTYWKSTTNYNGAPVLIQGRFMFIKDDSNMADVGRRSSYCNCIFLGYLLS